MDDREILRRLNLTENDISYHIIDEYGNIIPATYDQWQIFRQSPQKIIGITEINGFKIATYFLGIQDSWFKTVIYSSYSPYEYANYITYQDAVNGHNEACDKIYARTQE